MGRRRGRGWRKKDAQKGETERQINRNHLLRDRFIEEREVGKKGRVRPGQRRALRRRLRRWGERRGPFTGPSIQGTQAKEGLALRSKAACPAWLQAEPSHLGYILDRSVLAWRKAAPAPSLSP